MGYRIISPAPDSLGIEMYDADGCSIGITWFTQKVLDEIDANNFITAFRKVIDDARAGQDQRGGAQ